MYSSAMLYAAIGFAVNAGGGPSRPQNTASILHERRCRNRTTFHIPMNEMTA